jgi:hypothetical protein
LAARTGTPLEARTMTVSPHMAGFTATPATSEIALVDDIYIDSMFDTEDGETVIVKEGFASRFHRLYVKGLITTDAEAALRDLHWRRVSEKSRDNTNKMILDLASGQTTLEADAWLDLWITVGRSKRTTIRHMDPMIDWNPIIAIRQKGVDDLAAVTAAARRVAPLTQAAYAAHGSMEAAVRAGGLILTALPKTAAAV